MLCQGNLQASWENASDSNSLQVAVSSTCRYPRHWRFSSSTLTSLFSCIFLSSSNLIGSNFEFQLHTGHFVSTSTAVAQVWTTLTYLLGLWQQSPNFFPSFCPCSFILYSQHSSNCDSVKMQVKSLFCSELYRGSNLIQCQSSVALKVLWSCCCRQSLHLYSHPGLPNSGHTGLADLKKHHMYS